jgi:hypothetical protein
MIELTLGTYPILSRPCLPSALTGKGDGWTNGGNPKREAINEHWTAYLRLQSKIYIVNNKVENTTNGVNSSIVRAKRMST